MIGLAHKLSYYLERLRAPGQPSRGSERRPDNGCLGSQIEMISCHQIIVAMIINLGWVNTYENTIFSGMNIHKSHAAILMFTRDTGF